MTVGKRKGVRGQCRVFSLSHQEAASGFGTVTVLVSVRNTGLSPCPDVATAVRNVLGLGLGGTDF